MDKTQQWVAGAVLLCLALLAGAWFLLVSPARTEAAELDTAAQGQLAANAALRNQLRQLQEQAEQLPEQQAALARIAEKVPADEGYPELVRALDALAERTGVTLVKIVPQPLVVPAAPAAPAAVPTPGAAPAPAAAPASTWSTLPFTLDVAGGFYDVQAFVAGLEELSRAVRVTSLKVAPGANPVAPDAPTSAVEEGRSLMATLTAEAYVAPLPASGTGATPAAVPAPVPVQEAS